MDFSLYSTLADAIGDTNRWLLTDYGAEFPGKSDPKGWNERGFDQNNVETEFSFYYLAEAKRDANIVQIYTEGKLKLKLRSGLQSLF